MPIELNKTEMLTSKNDFTKDQYRELQFENKRLSSRLVKIAAVQENIIEAITSTCKALPSENPPKIDVGKAPKRYPEERAVLNISDSQIGSYVSKYLTGGLCEYNKTEFVKRIKRLTHNMLEITRIQRTGGVPVKKLNLHFLGDVVQGESIYPGQGFYLDALLLEQTFELASRFVFDVIIPLSREFEQVEIFCIPGNHGRQAGPRNSSREANWDYVAYIFWRQLLKEYKHIKLYISQSPFLIYELFPGQLHALIHGNQAKGWMGFPYYGIDRVFGRLKTLTNLPIQYLYHGHHHQPASMDAHIGRKIGNGSIEGGSEYSVCDLVTANVPQQFYCGVNSKGITWEYWIRLADVPKMIADDHGIFTPIMKE